ncbi:hypothetical protein D9M72_515200 [compost metagenome]
MAPRRLWRVHVRGAAGFRHAVALDQGQAEALLDLVGHGLRNGRGAPQDVAQRGQVARLLGQLGEHLDDHRCHAAPDAHAAPLKQFDGGTGVPARELDLGASAREQDVHHRHAAHVVEGHAGQFGVVLAKAHPRDALVERAHEGPVRHHRALGLAGGARGVGDDCEVGAECAGGQGRDVGGQGAHELVHEWVAAEVARCQHEVGNRHEGHVVRPASQLAVGAHHGTF